MISHLDKKPPHDLSILPHLYETDKVTFQDLKK